MVDLFKIYFSKPFLFLEMVILSLFINIFALVTPIFVILVFNRYISSGVDATLTTLAIGAFIAIIFEFLLALERIA